MEPVADTGSGASAAQPEAVDGGEPNALAGGALRRWNQRFDAARLARLGATDLHFGARVGRGAEIVVEASHTVDVGARKVELTGYLRLAFGIDAAEVVLPSIVIMKAGTAKYLANGSGHTLYVSDADEAGTLLTDPVSNCEKDCLATFEPFHLKTISAVTSLEVADFAVFVRHGKGGLQLAFKGRPLYLAKTDTTAGAMHGAEIAGFAAAILP